MSPRVETRLNHRTWIERLLLWRHAYETKIWEFGHEVIGRGPTPEVSQEAAMKRWNEEISQDQHAVTHRFLCVNIWEGSPKILAMQAQLDAMKALQPGDRGSLQGSDAGTTGEGCRPKKSDHVPQVLRPEFGSLVRPEQKCTPITEHENCDPNALHLDSAM
jgi:hypothetical protein